MNRVVVVSILIFVLIASLAIPALAAAPAAQVSCAGSLAPRLEVGDMGRIAQYFSTLRKAPAGEPIKVVYSPAEFEVLEGPICEGYGPLTWYRIEYANGDTGWASESQVYSIWGNNQYWLEPVPES